MTDIPVTRYVERDGISLAYQVFGAGGLDLVFVPGGVSHVDLAWQDRRYARFMRRLGSFARVTVFDKRGMGASDPVLHPPTLQERSEDIETVMDAAGVEQTALFGMSEGATSAALFAASFSQRTRALVLCGAFPGGSALVDVEPDYPAEAMGRFWACIVEPCRRGSARERHSSCLRRAWRATSVPSRRWRPWSARRRRPRCSAPCSKACA